MTTSVNNNYNFNCALCDKPTEIKTIEKGGTFSGHSLKCKKCKHTGYMFIVFVPEKKDLKELVDKYKSAIAESGGENDTGKN